MSIWWAELLGVEKVFVTLAVPFTVLTIINILMEIVGGGGEHGHDFDSGGDAFMDHFHFFSVRNLIYFLMMFGWTGLACSKGGLGSVISVFVGLIAGILTTVIIGWMFYLFSKLQEAGVTTMEDAVGKTATVYLTIPAKRSGNGVIQLVLHGRTQEMDAITDGDELSKGISVDVMQVIDGNKALVYKPEV